MPPRGKKGGLAKKSTPKSKQQEPTPSVPVEETKVSSPEVPASSVDDKKVVAEAVTPSTPASALEVDKKQEDVVITEKTETETDTVTVTVKGDEENVSGKMEVTSSTVVHEETETKVVEQTNVVEETVEEKNGDIVREGGDQDVEMVGNASDEEEPELLEAAESEEEEAEDQDEEQDDTQGVGEGEEPAAEVGGEENDNAGDNEVDDKEGEVDSESDDEDDEDPSAYMQLPLTDRKKQKDLEIFVGGLDRKAVEEDLTKVFAEFGEIKSLRIVKHPVTQKSKGFAFLRYASVDQAKKVLTDLKDGIEVKGKRVGISASQDSDTIYLGNICKTWSKEQVLEALKSLGVEQIEEIYLPEDANHEGKIRGFALLEFSTHSDAMTAFQRLRKPDAVLGRDRSAKVAFAQSMHPSEEALLKVKTVYVEGLTDSWDEAKLKEFCNAYGEVEKIQLSRNLVRTKRKDFGFVTFTSRESAVACVEGINNAQIGEGDIKVKANLAKPEYKGRLGKAARGGFKVPKEGEKNEEAGPSRNKGNGRSKGAETKDNAPAKGKNQSKTKGKVGEPQGRSAPTKSDKNRQRKEQPAKGRKREGRGRDAGYSGRPSKKPRGNTRGGPSGGYGSQMNSRPGRPRPSYGMAPSMYVADPYRQGYAPAGSSYQGRGYGAAPVSTHSYSDMEPHAGYLRPGAKQGRESYGYGPRSAGGYSAQGSGGSGYGGSAVPPPYPPAYSSYPGYSAGGYAYPSGRGYPPRQGYY